MTDDPKAIWRDQPNDSPNMGLSLVRARLAAHQARVNRSRWVLVVAAFAGVTMAVATAIKAHAPVIQGGELLLAGGFIVFFVATWRKLAIAAPPDDACAGVIYLRDRLVESRRRVGGGWLLMIAPLLPGMLVLLAALLAMAGWNGLPKLAPILVLFLLWLGALILVHWRERSRVKAELAELDRLRLG